MVLFLYTRMFIFGYLIIRTEMKPIDESVSLKLPISIEKGMNIILEGISNNEHEELSLTFSGENMRAQDECQVKFIPGKTELDLICGGIKKNVLLPKPNPVTYPTPFVIQFNARNVCDHYAVLELFYEGAGIVRGPLGEFINLPSFDLIDYITVSGFLNVHNVTFSFNRNID